MLRKEIKKGLACDSVGTPESTLGRAVCLSVHPGKMILMPFIHWFDKKYKGKFKFAKLLFSFDIFLIGALISLGIVALLLGVLHPTFEDNILFEAVVAPREIVSGASSTLVIRYTNNTEEPLRDAKLQLSYPDHFLLQGISIDQTEIEDGIIDLGNLAVGESGSIRVKGVMFGDVGGEQSFTSTMTFVRGEEQDISGKKVSMYTFSPSSSTLALTLHLPERLVAFQEVEGTVEYTNTGEIDFPVISIEPEWPEGFEFLSSPTSYTQGLFDVPAIKAGTSGTMEFTGYLGDVGEETTFVFHPSFTFGINRYRQQTLVHTAPVVPPQISVEHNVDQTTIRPGGQAVFSLQYENVGEFDVTNLVLSVESDSPFFSDNTIESEPIDQIAPGETGSIQISVPLKSRIYQSETSTYEALDLSTKAVATYTLGDGTGQRVQSKSRTLDSPITTPVVFESFGRYATASGDQLGRGPLPPRVGIETKYWVFWHVSGTINELTDVRIEGTLPSNVRFTGRQSTSQNSGITYDDATRVISWTSTSLPPTLAPTSKVIGIAFEVGITPGEEMIGEIPLLLYDVHLTGRDLRTGVFVSRSGATVTTNLPNDLMAAGNAIVED